MRGATTVWAEKTGRIGISIHAPLAGRDDPSNAILALHLHFNPRAPRGARRQLANQSAKRSIISIHAPHAGRDGAGVRVYRNYPGISIHAPHAGRDDFYVDFDDTARFISIHAPHAGRDDDTRRLVRWQLISIHAPHAGRDRSNKGLIYSNMDFNPRAPCGARLCSSVSRLCPRYISIHAPHAGRDSKFCLEFFRVSISIHAPHAGRDKESHCFLTSSKNFNPRAPCGARHPDDYPLTPGFDISIHAPHAGRDTLTIIL